MEKKEKKTIFTKQVILSSIIGLVIGAIIMFAVLYFVNNSAVIKVKGDKITKDELFGTMKEYFAVGLVIDEIDKMILPEKYTLTDDMKADIEDEAKYYLSMYESYYGYTEEEFLKENGFESKQEFLDYLGLDYRRNLYYYDYLESKLEDGAVQAYYDANKADVDKAENEHILVEVAEDATDEEEKAALTLANEIIAKLNEGKTFEEVAKEYKESAVHQELGFVGKDDAVAEEYLDALFALEDGKYSRLTKKETNRPLLDYRETYFQLEKALCLKALDKLGIDYKLNKHDIAGMFKDYLNYQCGANQEEISDEEAFKEMPKYGLSTEDDKLLNTYSQLKEMMWWQLMSDPQKYDKEHHTIMDNYDLVNSYLDSEEGFETRVEFVKEVANQYNLEYESNL